MVDLLHQLLKMGEEISVPAHESFSEMVYTSVIDGWITVHSMTLSKLVNISSVIHFGKQLGVKIPVLLC